MKLYRGITFAVAHKPDRDKEIQDAITYRKAGGTFLSAEESLKKMRAAIHDS